MAVESPARAEGARGSALRRDLRDAVTPRAFALVLGVLLLQLGFILSYLGAFHSPTPEHIRVGVVAPAGAPAATAQRLVGQLDGIAGSPLDARVVASPDEARAQLRDRRLDGALVLGTGSSDRLLVASAQGGSLAQALEQVVSAVAAGQGRTVAVDDVVPAEEGDARGLGAFYVAVGWVVGGYLVASILAIGAGAKPATPRRARIRLASLAVYSVLSGLGGALIAGPLLGALTGHFWAVAGFGTLLVFGVGAFTMAIQAVTGILGIGIAVLLFVVLGNPSAGGAYPGPLLPPFWRAIGPWLPPGAGTSALRGIVYFDGAGAGRASLVMLAYSVVGAAGLVAAAVTRHRPEHLAS